MNPDHGVLSNSSFCETHFRVAMTEVYALSALNLNASTLSPSFKPNILA